MKEVEIERPLARKSTFISQIAPKRQHRAEVIDKAIIALSAKGMNTRELQKTIKVLYSVALSYDLTMISEFQRPVLYSLSTS